MNMKLFGLVSLCGVLAIACGDSGTSGTGGSNSGGGSNGGDSSTGGTTSVTQPTTNTTGGGGTGGAPLECDTGEAGDLAAMAGTPEEMICSACIDCAFGGNCADELATLQGTPGAQAWFDCVFGNDMAMPPTTGCPDDDPATANVDEFQVCLDMCDAASPGVQDAYLALLSCAACVECPINCNAAGNCM